MKIAITGVAGLIGSSLARSLMSDNEVVGFDNFIGGYRDNVPENIYFKEMNVLDITSEDLSGVDIVVHAACTAHEGLSVFSPKVITENTFGISVSLLQAAINAGVKKFVYLSSMARYGYQDTLPFTEDMTPNPRDPYGVAKAAFEEILKIMSDIHGIEYVVIVPHNVIGPGQVYTDPFRNVAGIMVNRMLQGQQPVIYGDGSQMRSFSDIRDVVEPLKTAIFSDVAAGKVINIGPDENFITVKYLAEVIANQIGFDLDPIFLDPRPGEVKLANCSADRARDILGYSPKYSIEETVSEMIAWVSSRGPGRFSFNLPVEIVTEKTPKTWTDHGIFNS
jgi:UDP-glucose 4-epimerase